MWVQVNFNFKSMYKFGVEIMIKKKKLQFQFTIERGSCQQPRFISPAQQSWGHVTSIQTWPLRSSKLDKLTSYLPKLGFCLPAKIFRAVDLPIPLVPTSPSTSPGLGIGSLQTHAHTHIYIWIQFDNKRLSTAKGHLNSIAGVVGVLPVQFKGIGTVSVCGFLLQVAGQINNWQRSKWTFL